MRKKEALSKISCQVQWHSFISIASGRDSAPSNHIDIHLIRQIHHKVHSLLVSKYAAGILHLLMVIRSATAKSGYHYHQHKIV